MHTQQIYKEGIRDIGYQPAREKYSGARNEITRERLFLHLQNFMQILVLHDGSFVLQQYVEILQWEIGHKMLGFVHTDQETSIYALKLSAQELFLASASTWLYCWRVEIQTQALARNSCLKKHLYSFNTHYQTKTQLLWILTRAMHTLASFTSSPCYLGSFS